jgi:hypothetical protein
VSAKNGVKEEPNLYKRETRRGGERSSSSSERRLQRGDTSFKVTHSTRASFELPLCYCCYW